MVKLVYTYALGAYAAMRAGSSPVSGTTAPLESFLRTCSSNQVLSRAPSQDFFTDFFRLRIAWPGNFCRDE